MNWNEFFNMGGYGFFVWSSWGLTLMVLFLNIVLPKLKKRSIQDSIKRQYRREKLKQTSRK